ncbi:SDR family oxidoreductase [Gemmatimonas sp.]|uniref:SDR family NAD(P)-dependent oxidoreductase n=1 Tax=Gemmatimonas sp. TaxID=1962908 RepID=UPI00286E211E|nr:SDR family oxidoreductase [Gemmatimonas sp.]
MSLHTSDSLPALAGRHAMVTGANRGIGAAIARALSANGARVSLLVRDAARAKAVAASLSGPYTVVVADVTDREALVGACVAAAEALGPVDILVNNAGTAESAPFLKSDTALFERMLAMHLMAPVYASQVVLPGMIERSFGHIVNVASVAGLMGAPYVTAYTAAKHAMIGLTRSLALEAGPRGVAVNAVCPAYTDTDLVTGAVERIVQRTGRTANDALQSILADAGQTRIVTSEEVADAVLALCTAPIGAAIGQTIVIDGRADDERTPERGG